MTMRMQLVRKPADTIDENMDRFYRNVQSVVFSKIYIQHYEYVETWEKAEDIPKFTIETEHVPGGAEISVLMEALPAEQATLSVWQLLNREDGTEVRPMHVNKDWVDKTEPGAIVSGPGGDNVKMGIWKPYAEGIDSRRIALSIAEHYEQEIDDEVYKYAQLALTLEFHRSWKK